MKNFNSLFYILFAGILLLSSCAKDEVCEDVNCPEGYVPTDENGICSCLPDSDAINVVTKGGIITADETWTSDNVYKLQGKVIVSSGVTLTIQPGTIIKGSEGTGSVASALVIARGATLNAIGNSAQPIIMTSILDDILPGQKSGTTLDETQNGLWGGLIILGNAPCSFEANVVEFQIEGIPADETYGLYGGNDPNDNSGIINFLSIRHGGALIGANNEINGLTLGGVGSGTVIGMIEVVANQDDGIEFFGGTVNVTDALVWAQGDDAFDVDQAYSGTVDNFIYIAGPDSDHGLEIDGPEGSALGSFKFINGTLKGLDTEMVDFRKSAQGELLDCKFFNFPGVDGDLEIDDVESSTNFSNGALIIKGNDFVTTLTVADICHDKSTGADEAAFDAQMTIDNATVSTSTKGADPERFEWTYAAEKGMLIDFQ